MIAIVQGSSSRKLLFSSSITRNINIYHEQNWLHNGVNKGSDKMQVRSHGISRKRGDTLQDAQDGFATVFNKQLQKHKGLFQLRQF